VNIPEFKKDVADEDSTILNTSFSIQITDTNTVPHSDDGAITFPNLDEKTQGVKVVETTVLYVDMRRSTELSLKHHPRTVAKLYSAFVRAMTRCAEMFGGEVRGIIGDRVMMLFDKSNCFSNAIDTAVLINSVCTYVINQHFTHSQVTFGIGIDYGRMLATKTGVRRHGSAQQSYRSLVWLGRPANVASKLTDNANKPEEPYEMPKVRVAFNYGTGSLTYETVAAWDFVQDFAPRNPVTGTIPHKNPAFHSFEVVKEKIILRPKTPAILMSKRVYDGYKNERPLAEEIVNNWYKRVPHTFDDVPDAVYGGNVSYNIFRSPVDLNLPGPS
jgi:adenylate cyclase